MTVRQTRQEWLATLDPGIRYAVDVLDANGVETYESCQGGDGHAYTEPTVRFYGVRSEGFRALHVALVHALPVRCLNRHWQMTDGEPVGPQWELVFYSPEATIERAQRRIQPIAEAAA